MKLIQHLCVALGLLAASIPAMAGVVEAGTIRTNDLFWNI